MLLRGGKGSLRSKLPCAHTYKEGGITDKKPRRDPREEILWSFQGKAARYQKNAEKKKKNIENGAERRSNRSLKGGKEIIYYRFHSAGSERRGQLNKLGSSVKK